MTPGKDDAPDPAKVARTARSWTRRTDIAEAGQAQHDLSRTRTPQDRSQG
jgi:hypothetical protein